MRLIRNPHSRQFTGAMQLGEIDRVTPISLDPIAGPSRDQRRCDDHTFVSGRRQLPLDPVATWSGLVAEPQVPAAVRQSRHHPLQGSRCVRNLAMLAYFSPLARFGQCDCNRIFVHVQTNVDDRLVHDPSPMHEAPARTTRRNPRKPAYCETGRPYLRRTSGLGTSFASVVSRWTSVEV